MVHKLFNASNPAQLLKAAVIGVFFAYECAGPPRPIPPRLLPPSLRRPPLRAHVNRPPRRRTSTHFSPPLTCVSAPSLSASPLDAPGPFMSKFQNVFANLTVQNADSSDVVAVNNTADPATGFNLMTDVFGTASATRYYRYNGSLTTPGCNEGIFWHIMDRPLTLSRMQLLSFTRLLATEQGGMGRGADNRLIQPLNGRSILASFGNPATPPPMMMASPPMMASPSPTMASPSPAASPVVCPPPSVSAAIAAAPRALAVAAAAAVAAVLALAF